MPKAHHDGEKKKPRKKSPPTKRQTLVRDLRAEKKKLTAALRLVCRDLRSFGIGKIRKA